MDFFKKVDNINDDLYWNIPERAQGIVNIIGGNLQNFRTPVKIAEFLSSKYPIESTKLVLPDALKNKLPPLPNLIFLKSTDSGSLADGEEIVSAINSADYNLIIGDLSKNSITEKALAFACESAGKPTLITRDAVDSLANAATESVLSNENIVVMGSMVQLQKLLKAVYYPRMLMLSSPLSAVAETLHKFTLSYPVSLVTLHNGQILIAKDGVVRAIDLGKTGFSPISFWSGELAAKIVVLNLYNPNNFIDATISAIASSQH